MNEYYECYDDYSNAKGIRAKRIMLKCAVVLIGLSIALLIFGLIFYYPLLIPIAVFIPVAIFLGNYPYRKYRDYKYVLERNTFFIWRTFSYMKYECIAVIRTDTITAITKERCENVMCNGDGGYTIYYAEGAVTVNTDNYMQGLLKRILANGSQEKGEE